MHAGKNATVKNLLEEHIVYFAHLLRKQGLRVGTAEVLDALEAIKELGVTDRGTFRTILKGTMVKKVKELLIFDRTFQQYFTSPDVKQQALEIGKKHEANYRKNLEEAEKELIFQGDNLNLDEEEKIIYTALSDSERKRLREFIEETERGHKVQASFKPLLESLVKGSLRYRKSRLEEVPQRPPSITGVPEWDWMLAGTAGTGSGKASLKELDMSEISEEDIPLAAEIAQKISRRLALNISRRYRQSRKKQMLDLRRSIRGSISYGGSFYRLKYRKKKQQKPRLLLLCDVSGSMARYTGFILPFMYGLTSVVRHIESFVFAEKLERITPYILQGSSFESTMEEVIKRSGQWGGGTRISAALEQLARKHGEVLTPKTIFIMVSDTMTTSLDRSLANLKELRARVKDIIWLNPLPCEEWERFRSVREFKRITRMFACRKLVDLERIFDKRVF